MKNKSPGAIFDTILSILCLSLALMALMFAIDSCDKDYDEPLKRDEILKKD